MENILVIEDTQSLREVLCTVLKCKGYAAEGVASAEMALSRLKEETFTIVLSDLKLPGMSGLEFLRTAKSENSALQVLVMTAYGSIDLAVEAMKLGAADFITKPFDPSMLCNALEQLTSHRRIVDRNLTNNQERHRQFVSQNPSVLHVIAQAKRVAALTSPVLILGESGTGKELLARLIHEHSPRFSKQFIPVNCGSIPDEILESEFFGHEEGAFTGATAKRVGLFEVANKGTIFLDEIATMSPSLQIKLLRVLQESEIRPLGSSKIKSIDTRVISATNCNPEQAIKEGKFREDLYYRLGVVVLELPPLRSRPEDIELIANYFIKTFAHEFDKPVPVLSKEALKLLQAYNWPGNIRELENVIEQAMVFNSGEPIHVEELRIASNPLETNFSPIKSLTEVSSEASKNAEISAIKKALAQCKGNKSHAAKVLGVSYKTLLNKVKEYETDLGNF